MRHILLVFLLFPLAGYCQKDTLGLRTRYHDGIVELSWPRRNNDSTSYVIERNNNPIATILNTGHDSVVHFTDQSPRFAVNTYRVRLRDSIGGTKYSEASSVQIFTSPKVKFTIRGLWLIIDTPEDTKLSKSVWIIDEHGREVYTRKFVGGELKINMSRHHSGEYVISVHNRKLKAVRQFALTSSL